MKIILIRMTGRWWQTANPFCFYIQKNKNKIIFKYLYAKQIV